MPLLRGRSHTRINEGASLLRLAPFSGPTGIFMFFIERNSNESKSEKGKAD